MEENSPEKSTEYRFECAVCGLLFTSTTAPPTYLDASRLQCIHCMIIFRNPRAFRRHMSMRHFLTSADCSKLHGQMEHRFNLKPAVAKSSELKCETCNAKFRLNVALNQHLARNHKHWPYSDPVVCRVCNRTFKCNANLVSHMISHRTNEVRRKTRCSVCKYRYSNKFDKKNEGKCSTCLSEEEEVIVD